MKRKVIYSIAILLIILLNCSFVFAQSQQIKNGINYLATTQNTDGSWGNTTRATEIVLTTS